MVHIKIKENSKKAKAFIEFARTMEFVEFVETDDLQGTNTKISKKQFLSDFKKSVEEVKQGKTKPIRNLHGK